MDAERLAEVLMLTSEVVTNAVVHVGGVAGHNIGLCLTRDGEMVLSDTIRPFPTFSEI